MKVLYTTLIIASLAGSHLATAQNSINEETPIDLSPHDPIFIKHYEKLKKMHVFHCKNLTYQKRRRLEMAFLKKMNFKGKHSDRPKDELKWIKENLEQTSFGTLEKAEREWKIAMEAIQNDLIENSEYYEYKELAVKTCGPYVLLQVISDVNKGKY